MLPQSSTIVVGNHFLGEIDEAIVLWRVAEVSGYGDHVTVLEPVAIDVLRLDYDDVGKATLHHLIDKPLHKFRISYGGGVGARVGRHNIGLNGN